MVNSPTVDDLYLPPVVQNGLSRGKSSASSRTMCFIEDNVVIAWQFVFPFGDRNKNKKYEHQVARL